MGYIYMKAFVKLTLAAALLFSACTNQTSTTMQNTFLDLAVKRYSVRSFTDQKVPKEDIDKIIEAGRVAPTAVNNQPQKIYLLQSEEAIRKINTVSPCIYGAPQVFLVCYDEDLSWVNQNNGNQPSGVIDASIVLTHMMLQCAELGLGSCWVGMFDMVMCKTLFDLPDNIHPIALLPFGYPSEDSKPSKMHTSYRPLEETVKVL